MTTEPVHWPDCNGDHLHYADGKGGVRCFTPPPLRPDEGVEHVAGK